MTIITTMRGKKIDVSKLVSEQKHKKAYGGCNLTVSGDVIGKNGKIVATMKQVADAYNRNNPKAVKKVGIASISGEIFTPGELKEEIKKEAPPVPAHEKEHHRRKKMTDSE